jgi:hypothetical protein
VLVSCVVLGAGATHCAVAAPGRLHARRSVFAPPAQIAPVGHVLAAAAVIMPRLALPCWRHRQPSQCSPSRAKIGYLTSGYLARRER